MSTVFPALPERVSNDGSELWDWAGRMAHAMQRNRRIAELEHDIKRCGTVCGDCYLWMKSRECPRERPGEGKRSGYSVGPSMNDSVCNQYVETSETTQRRETKKCELAVLTKGQP